MAVHCRLKQSVTSPAYVDSYHISASSDVSTVKSIANEALTRMLARDKCDVTKISPVYGSADLQFKCSVSPVKVLCVWYALFVFFSVRNSRTLCLLWNSLSPAVINCDTLSVFKSR